MLKILLHIIWILMVTFVVIPITYILKVFLVILSFLWNFDTKMVTKIYWKGLAMDNEYLETEDMSFQREVINFPWKDVYNLNFFPNYLERPD